MIDFDLMEVGQTATTIALADFPPVITEKVQVRNLPTTTFRAEDVAVPPEHWSWEQLRDYVVRQIETIHGPYPRNFIREASIFKSFLTRWDHQAGAIARCAFEVHGGMWKGAPITTSRFCKGSDPFFALLIAETL